MNCDVEEMPAEEMAATFGTTATSESSLGLDHAPDGEVTAAHAAESEAENGGVDGTWPGELLRKLSDVKENVERILSPLQHAQPNVAAAPTDHQGKSRRSVHKSPSRVAAPPEEKAGHTNGAAGAEETVEKADRVEGGEEVADGVDEADGAGGAGGTGVAVAALAALAQGSTEAHGVEVVPARSNGVDDSFSCRLSGAFRVVEP